MSTAVSAANHWDYACGTRCGLSPRRRVHTVSSRVGSACTRRGPTAAAVVKAAAVKRWTRVCQRRHRTRSILVASSVPDIVCRGRSAASVVACGATAQSGRTGWNVLRLSIGAPSAASIGMRRRVRFAAVRPQQRTTNLGAASVQPQWDFFYSFARANQVAPQRVTRACRAVVAPP